MAHFRPLAVLLCYNDADILGECISYLLTQKHEVVVWDHGSTDGTAGVLHQFRNHLRECTYVPRTFDFYGLYGAMSQHLIDNYVGLYDWISWPDQDEFLEGPDRTKPYVDWLEEVYESPYNWIQFHNFNYWFTEADPAGEIRATERIRYYSLFPDCAPRIRSWRAEATNIRFFNHNSPIGERYPVMFNLRHYPMRSKEQMERRLAHDRKGLRRGGTNFHYDNMEARRERLLVRPEQLHFDDRQSELDPKPIFNWREIYGYGPPAE